MTQVTGTWLKKYYGMGAETGLLQMISKDFEVLEKVHHALLLCLHTAALRSYVICTHLFRTAVGALRYRVDNMAYKDHVCFAAVCRSYVGFNRKSPEVLNEPKLSSRPSGGVRRHSSGNACLDCLGIFDSF